LPVIFSNFLGRTRSGRDRLGFSLLLWRSGLTSQRRVILCLLVLLAAGTAAYFGKMQFAASFAEDRLAGQAWYFGWIGVVAAIGALISSALLRDFSDRRPE
jgi:hypothetical protein